MKHEVTKFFSNEGIRNDVRMRVVEAFAEEFPGKGKGDAASKYIYYVETLKDGNRVYLQRPAFLYNGFDFLVCVENTNYSAPGERSRNNPKHKDIQDDLIKKKAENPELYKNLYMLLQKVYECHDVKEEEYADISFSSGLPVEHILKVMKWLFIEQDIRYWNYSGRNMTWSLVPDKD